MVSSMTIVSGLSSNLAVLAIAPPPDTDWPIPRASELEKASMINIVGLWPSRPCLVSWLNITPEETMATSELRSQRSGWASRARRIGLPKASPTTAVLCTPSASTTSRNSVASKVRLGRVTTVPPPHSVVRAVNPPVPCISGQAGMPRLPGSAKAPSRSAIVPSSSKPMPRVAPRRTTRSSWRHITPLGMPVVPPV